MATFKALIQATGWEAVKAEVLEKCSDGKENIASYERVYSHLKNELEPNFESKYAGYTLKAEWDSENEGYVSATMVSPEDNIGYALDFVPWEEILVQEVDENSLAEFDPAQIIVAALYDMTFDGFDQASAKAKLSELEARIENAKNEENRLTWDEVKRKLKDE